MAAAGGKECLVNMNILQNAIIERTDKLELNKKNEIKQDDLVITSILDRFK